MRRILVVDDDPHTRAAIGLWLKHCGFKIAIPDDGASGLAALKDAGTEQKACCNPAGHWQRSDKCFEREGEYGLNCRKDRAAFVVFVDSDETAEVAGQFRITRKFRRPRDGCD